MALEPALFVATSGQGKGSVPNQYHDHRDHVLVQHKSQQPTGETTVPDSVISSCQIDKHGTSLFGLKRILNVLHEQNDLIYGRLHIKIQSVPLGAKGQILV